MREPLDFYVYHVEYSPVLHQVHVESKSSREITFPAVLILPDVEGDSGGFSTVFVKLLLSLLKDLCSSQKPTLLSLTLLFSKERLDLMTKSTLSWILFSSWSSFFCTDLLSVL